MAQVTDMFVEGSGKDDYIDDILSINGGEIEISQQRCDDSSLLAGVADLNLLQ